MGRWSHRVPPKGRFDKSAFPSLAAVFYAAFADAIDCVHSARLGQFVACAWTFASWFLGRLVSRTVTTSRPCVLSFVVGFLGLWSRVFGALSLASLGFDYS